MFNLRIFFLVSFFACVSVHAAENGADVKNVNSLEQQLAILDKRIADAKKQDTWLNSSIHFAKKLPIPIAVYAILCYPLGVVESLSESEHALLEARNRRAVIFTMGLLAWAFNLFEASPQHKKVEQLVAQKDLLLEQASLQLEQ